ncbi:hypothetical protein C8Q80DRAFT_195226 [Daedaleopsis nitida]|nr:hypothetical protein C8Q80DRAFT_195226 [Daedaleopsis nitida]
MHFSYYYLVNIRTADLQTVDGSVWSANILGVFEGAIICLCQTFLARSVYLLGRQYGLLVVVLAGVLNLAQFGLSQSISSTTVHTDATIAAATVLVNASRANYQYISTIRRLNCTHLGMALAAILVLAGALTYSLHRSRTGFHKTDSVITVLMRYTVNTGLLIGIMTFLSLVLAIVLPDTQTSMAVDIVTTKIYANTLLAHVIDSTVMRADIEKPETRGFWSMLLTRKMTSSSRGRSGSPLSFMAELSRSASHPSVNLPIQCNVIIETEVFASSQPTLDDSRDVEHGSHTSDFRVQYRDYLAASTSE